MAQQSPKIIFSVSQDFVPATTPEPTVPYFAVFSSKGPVEAQLVDLAGYETLFGAPDVLNYGITGLYPYLFLQRTGGVAYVRRALHVEDISSDLVTTYGGATARWIKESTADLALNPIDAGIEINTIEDYIFPSSADNRNIFKESLASVFEAVTLQTSLKVSNPDTILRDASEISVLALNEVPDDLTPTIGVLDVTDVLDIANYIKLDAVTGQVFPAGEKVMQVETVLYNGYILNPLAYAPAQTVSGDSITVSDSALFALNDTITFPGVNATTDLQEHTVLAIIDSTTIQIDSTLLNNVVITENQPIATLTTSAETVVDANVYGDLDVRAIPIEDATESTTFSIHNTVDVEVGDRIYTSAANFFSRTSYLVTDVYPNEAGDFNTITIDTAVSLVGATTPESAFGIIVETLGAEEIVLRELISPITGLNVVLEENTSDAATDVLVDDNDPIATGMLVAIVNSASADGDSYEGEIFTITNKFNLDKSYTRIDLDAAVSATITAGIFVKVNSDLLEPDAFLIVGLTPGKWDNTLTVDIQDGPAGASDDIFTVRVIKDGVSSEFFTCSRLKDAVDSYNNSLFIEDVINGSSTLIWVVDNADAINPADGLPYKPVFTDTMTLRPIAAPQYDAMNTVVSEKVFVGDSVLRVTGENATDITNWSIGDTLSIVNADSTLSSYEIYLINVDPVNNKVANFTIVGTFQEIHLVEADVQKLTGFVQGADLKIAGNDYTVDIGDSYRYNNSSYTVVDSGSNYFKFGQDGKLFEEADFVAAFEGLDNIDKYPEELLLSDGGQAKASTFSSLAQFAQTRKRCMLYGSIPMISLSKLENQYTEEAIDYADSTLTTDKYCSLFAGNSKVSYGANQYWISDHLFNIISQYDNTIIREGVLPAANNRGKITGITAKDITLSIPYQDQLEKKQINYSRKVGAGYTVMSNTTRFNIDSYFQYKHIIHYINAIHSIVEKVFQPYLQEVVTDNDVENVDTAIGNLLTRQLNKMTDSYETESRFLSNGNGTTTWNYKLWAKPRDVTTLILFDLTVTNKTLDIKVIPA